MALSMTADKEAIMQYTVMINTSTDKHGCSHRKCVVTLPYECVKNAGLVGSRKDRTVQVDYDEATQTFRIKKEV